MKSLIKIFILFIIVTTQLFSQKYDHDFCNYVDQGNGRFQFPYFGSGTLNILVVVCKFSDDNFDLSPHTDLWPHTLNSMPIWAPNLVSQTIQGNYNDPSLSGYFQDMSLGNFNVMGDVVFYQPLHGESYYFISNGRHLGYLSQEILEGINNSINFANYDNWDPNDIDGEGIKNEPDGQVDFIAICFRFANSVALDNGTYQGIAGLTVIKKNLEMEAIN